MSELQTKGYIPLHADSDQAVRTDLILAQPIDGMKHDELVLRKDAEVQLVALRAQITQQSARLDKALQNAADRIDGWRKSYEIEASNAALYRDAIMDMGNAIGRPCRVNSDGGVVYEPIIERVRDIVITAYKPRNRFVRAFRMLIKGF